MKLYKLSIIALATLITFLNCSCGSLPVQEKDLGPQSEHSPIPWNRRQQGEGEGALGGFSR